MNPPPIGDALRVGWNTVKANMVPMIIATLCAMVAGMVFMAIPGLMYVSLKAIRGKAPEPADAFIGFKKFVDHLVLVLLQSVGFIACCVGVYVTQAIFIPGTALVLDRDLTWSQAKDKCMEHIKPNWWPWTLFFFVTALVGGSGLIPCGLGLPVTIPIATCAWAYAYEQTLAKA
jgi:uncharacterized membrane protein